jgi:hypothetical protein
LERLDQKGLSKEVLQGGASPSRAFNGGQDRIIGSAEKAKAILAIRA